MAKQPVQAPGFSVPSFIIRLLGSGKAGEAAKKLAAAKKKKQAEIDKITKDM